MKKLLLLLLITAGLQTALRAQEVFPTSNAKWTEVEISGEAPLLSYRYYTYYIEGDTIINEIKRAKVYHCEFDNLENTKLIGFIHSDQKKVWFRLIDDYTFFTCIGSETDYLLYDFGLEKGDFVAWCEYKVTMR